MRKFIFIVLISLPFSLISQVNITTGSYYQDFGNVDITTWTNNITVPGWYAFSHFTAVPSILHANITPSAPINTGGFYSYECSNINDQKLGTRPSNSNPGAVGRYIRYGIYLRNTTGQTISSIRIRYRGYQLSLAENDGIVNRIEFHYNIGNIPPLMTSGMSVSVPALNYIAPNNDLGGVSSQLLGYPCNVFQDMDACIPVNFQDNQYLMLRWSDLNDNNNDPHLAIDNVIIDFGIQGSIICDVILPVELSYFGGVNQLSGIDLEWITSSEHDNSHFEIERSYNGIDFDYVSTILGSGNSQESISYQYTDRDFLRHSVIYYRLKQFNLDGTYTYSDIISVELESNITIKDGFISYDGDKIAKIYSISGSEIWDLNSSPFYGSGTVFVLRVGDRSEKISMD